MDSIKIKVVGNASKEVISQYKKAFNCERLNNNLALMFCSFSEFDIPIGQVFNIINDIEETFELNCQIILKNVTQQFWKPFDSIPSGWKTICLFEFALGEIPDVVQKLPIINGWHDSDTSVWFVAK
jgi:hypothetical protein